MFARRLIEILRQYPDGATYVDLFGGSGLLSHITKHQKPQATVIYNDYDHYTRRISHIPQTNRLLEQIRRLTSSIPRHKSIPQETKGNIIRLIRQEEQQSGYVDYITLSSSLLFSMKYATSLDSLRKETLYNNVRTTPYDLCHDYLDGLTVTHLDYRKLFNQYRDTPNVVFLIDPPYLSTEVGTYTMSWDLADYLDVLQTLVGTNYIYFTSNKSSIIELCEWMGRHPSIGNPFEGSRRIDFNAHMNYNSGYTDIMLYRAPCG